jgi:hypothetical protein
MLPPPDAVKDICVSAWQQDKPYMAKDSVKEDIFIQKLPILLGVRPWRF